MIAKKRTANSDLVTLALSRFESYRAKVQETIAGIESGEITHVRHVANKLRKMERELMHITVTRSAR